MAAYDQQVPGRHALEYMQGSRRRLTLLRCLWKRKKDWTLIERKTYRTIIVNSNGSIADVLCLDGAHALAPTHFTTAKNSCLTSPLFDSILPLLPPPLSEITVDSRNRR